MYSVQAGMWDPRPPSKHASPLPSPPPSNSRPAHVTTAAPAKRITFYKSGDSQFGGVRMAIHKRSFKCFDALLDDLSQKVPLPFGVRTVTTPRGTNTIRHLEQLQDGGCYLCSDRRHAKPINMELASKGPSIWYHHNRRPHRPEVASATPPSHVPYRQRRILLLKNSEPGVRRSVVLSRRSTRSLRAFLDEVSEVMQFQVRKLYTAEGRKIDSVQSLMTCPGVLVCVGREAFSPMLVNFIKKSSEEKLPGLDSRSPGLGPRTPGNGARSPATQGGRSPPHGAQSRASEYSDGHESKKNVNFGLETKKSIIHPRSDSSNRSTRFSVSSEKSYGGHGASGYSQARPAIMNDDIEKRVLVNKDGSLSVEMRVRFRLHNDETIQWSTQIKKSQSLTNDCCPLSQGQTQYLHQGQSESCSDPDSMSFDPEALDYSSQQLQRALGANHCPCCHQRQEQQYDLWENPAHSRKKPLVPPRPPPASSHTHTIMRHTNSSSSSSSCNSRRVVHHRAQRSSCGRGSGSEQSQLIQEEMCVTEQVEHRVEVEQVGDTQVEVCRVSRCCSRSEVVAMESNLLPLGSKSVEDELMEEEEAERPPSTVSSSSHVLRSLKEDQDDEDDDLPPSVSRCCQSNDKPSSKISAVTIHSVGHKENKDDEERSVASSCHCGAVTPRSTAEAEEMERAPTAKSKLSRASCRSGRDQILKSEGEAAAEHEDEEVKRVVSGLSGHTGLSAGSQKSWVFSVCPNCGGCKRGVRSESNRTASRRSHHSHRVVSNPVSPLAKRENDINGTNDDGSDDSAMSTQSNKTNLTSHGSFSAVSNVPEDTSSVMSRASNPAAAVQEEERAPSAISATSHGSNRSRKSCSNGATAITADKEEERSPSATSARSNLSATSRRSGTRQEAEGGNAVERAISSLSAKSGVSAKTGTSVKSHKSNCPLSPKVASPTDNTAAEDDETNRITPSRLSERPDSALSAKSNKSNVSAETGTSHRSTCSHCSKAKSPGAKGADGEGTEGEMRAASAVSAKSKNSQMSAKASEAAEAEGDGEERATSQISARSDLSNSSAKSRKSNCNDNTGTASVLSCKSASSAKSQHTKTDADAIVDRTSSSMSGKSSKSQKSDCAAASPNREEKQNESQGRVASAMSVKSKSSVRSSSKNLKSASPSPNAVIINAPEGVDEEDETAERAPSTASAKSGKSNSTSNHNGTANIDVIETTDADEHSFGQKLSTKRTNSSRIHSPRGPSALSVHSATSAKSGRSKCHCGATSAVENVKKEKEGEDKDEGASEQAASIISSSSKRQRRESGGTEQPLSRCSSGSVSLGLPEDQETADSDSAKSSFSFHTNNESKGRMKAASNVPKSQRGSAVKEDVEGTGSNINGNKSCMSHSVPAVDIPTIETPGGGGGGDEEGEEQKTERAASALTAKSSRSHKSSCDCSVKAASKRPDRKSKEQQHASASPAGNDLQSESVMSASATKASNLDSPSRPASELRGKEDIADDRAASVHSNRSCCLRPESAVSAQSGSKTKASKQSKGEDSVVSDSSNPVEAHKVKSNAGSERGNVEKKETLIKPSSPLQSSRPCSKVETCSESTLSPSLSAADLLKETMATCPQSVASKASNRTGSEQSARCQRVRNQKDQKEKRELTPACLPNASPIEVVNDWLRSIPANSSMLALGDELEEGELEKEVEEEPGEEEAKETSPEGDKMDEEQKPGAEEGEAQCDPTEGERSSDPAPGDAVEISGPNTLLRDESLPRNWQSSTAVMKVLLGSSLGRCRSMPEVSPVHGRRLSTSAQGFLDCLAQLQLIDPAVSPGCDQQKTHNQQYEDIMTILQSLWLTGPSDIEAKKVKDIGPEQVTPPRSSSGVDMSSGSAGSGKENGIQGGDKTSPKETESLQEEHGAEKVVEETEERNTEAGDKEAEAEPEGSSTEQATADGAEEQVQSEEQSTVPPSLDSPKATENPSSSDKSSGNNSSPTDNEQDTVEDTSSGTTSTVLRAPLSKKQSPEPDPVWVLHLLKKVEKQFINHYINAMAEFKVRWDLDDSLILDTMITELRDEVSRRIESSVEREIKKIQSRAGRGGRSPRPPRGGNLSRESTMTEKRRRILKVMKNQSVKTADSLSDGEMTPEFSDQRSEDDYCPCDACVRKKMAARPLKAKPNAAEAPVMMEFDLLKILQLKKGPPSAPAAAPQTADVESDRALIDEEGRNLEVVQEEEEEEEEETKEDIKAEVVLEEMIPEEDEEIGQDEEEEKVGTEREGNSGEDEEQGEAQTGGEETGEEEASVNGKEEEEEEEEGEAECQCHSATNEEETSDNTGEDETADDEEKGKEEEEEEVEENIGGDEAGDTEDVTGTEEEEEETDKETVKEATAGEKEEEEEEEECEVSDIKPEEEETTTGRGSGEEEEETDENAAKGSSADNEDGGDDDTGEEESHDRTTGDGSEEQEAESREQGMASPQDQGVTEGEDADAEDSDTDKKSPGDTSADEFGCEGAVTTGDEEGGDGDEVEEAVEEIEPKDKDEEEEEEEEVNGIKKEDGGLLHQFTRTSVESQPGSLEEVHTDSPSNSVSTMEVPKMADDVSTGGGTRQIRSRSPARIKRRKPKESDVEVEDF